MKKTLLIVIALALVFTLALTLVACEPSGSKEQTPQGGTPSTPDGGQPPETPDGGETPETPDEGDEGETPTPPVTYTVTFETNGGSAVQPVTVDEGTAITPAPETTLEGYEFGGWYSSADLSDDSLVTFPYTPAGSTTLYAKWSKILTAADLYNEVFGEDYAYYSYQRVFNDLTEKIFVNAKSFDILFSSLADGDFVIYANANNGSSNMLWAATYLGSEYQDFVDFYQLDSAIGEQSFKNYVIENLPSNISPNSEDINQYLQQLNELKDKVEKYKNLAEQNSLFDFRVSNRISNTTTEIEFADFAAKFMPAGVTPIACYVGECGPRYIDTKYFVEYFGIGYYSVVRITLAFMNNDSSIAVSEYEFIVRALNNQEASESIYNRLLNGNETTDYIVSNVDTTTIENPIWTGYTVGVTK